MVVLVAGVLLGGIHGASSKVARTGRGATPPGAGQASSKIRKAMVPWVTAAPAPRPARFQLGLVDRS